VLDREIEILSLKAFSALTLFVGRQEGHPAASEATATWRFTNFVLYTVSQKKQDTKLLPITSPNVNRFSKFFHW